MGHAHSLVLCEGSQPNTTELYVFGSNHFGQLGLGSNKNDSASETSSNSSSSASRATDDEMNCAGQVKYLLPQRLEFDSAKIRLIHTKFFTNVSICCNSFMYKN